MRNVLIINGNGFTPCSHNCGSLITLLRRAAFFDSVQETSIESPQTDINLIPDLILPRFLLQDWTRQGMKLFKKTWASAKTFALLCDQEVKHNWQIPPALIDVDDFLVCPYQDNELSLRIKRLLKVKRQTEPSLPHQAIENWRELDLLVGGSETFLKVLRKVGLLAQSKAPVVISGETGSGKELLARAIHYQSVRKGKPFIPVNCGALPDDLFENELFGHLKGAYTSASTAENGLITEAEGGTLFLDEVDALSPAAQIKLLRFLQSGEYRPLGSSRALVADVRIIAATNTDLYRSVELKLFREDLHYRLNVLSLLIPALRDRGTDVLALASHFLSVYAREHDRLTPRLSEEAMSKLLNYSWPGNVRELEGVIQRAIVLQESEVLTPEDLELPKFNDRIASQPEQFRRGKSLAIGQFERNFLATLLATHGGNISQAARAAGKDRRSFQRLVSKHALDRRSFKN
ncbi:MAG: sigma-54-dependent Fis family transcriptional regulator [Pyrinomonadaceae bacterium]|nr:sigma-54-dependent Fis family transcriptional regulator [Pyrinomonadaceae bacterium]